MNAIFLSICLLLICSCKNKITEFIYLDKLSGGSLAFYDGRYRYDEKLLIDRPPVNKDALKKIMVRYYNNIGKNIYALNEKYGSYQMFFYKKTRNTAYFIDHEEDPGGFSSYMIDDYKQDYLGSICYDRCKDDSTKWLSTIYLVLKADEYGVLESRTDTLKNECK